MLFRRSSHNFIFITFTFIFLIYLSSSFIVSQGNLTQTHLSYYNYLLTALYHGRLHVAPYASATDLAWFNGKWYLYWGPAPLIFIAPFYLIARSAASDVIYTLTAGLINLTLFYFVLTIFNQLFKLKKSLISILFILLNFALISPHLYLSLQGRIWHTNQVIAVTYLLLFLLFYFMFWSRPTKFFYLTLSILFLNFAVLSRYTMIFYFTLFLPLFYHLYQTKNISTVLKSFFLLISFSLSALALLFIYNHARFNNIFETGVRYVNIRSSEHIFISKAQQTSLISPKYFPHNFQVYFLDHIKLYQQKPFLIINKEGNSLVSLYPLVLFTPLLFLKKIFRNQKYSLFLTTAFLGVILPIILYLLLYLATGWAQFGTRYFLDAVPLLFLLLLLTVNEIPRPLQILILIYGISINLAGAYLFYQ